MMKCTSNDCDTCNGTGRIKDWQGAGPFIQKIEMPCGDCNGNGWRCIEDHHKCPNLHRCDVGQRAIEDEPAI